LAHLSSLLLHKQSQKDYLIFGSGLAILILLAVSLPPITMSVIIFDVVFVLSVWQEII